MYQESDQDPSMAGREYNEKYVLKKRLKLDDGEVECPAKEIQSLKYTYNKELSEVLSRRNYISPSSHHFCEYPEMSNSKK